MVGILLLTHYALGEQLLIGARHVLGGRDIRAACVALGREDDPETLFPQVRETVRALDDGSGVLILTDLYGASPANLAYRLIEPGRVEAVAGVNLPMVVRAACYAHEALEVVVSKAVTGGLEGVMYMLPPIARELGLD
jgi:PTS system ascorbate-specific IIA component